MKVMKTLGLWLSKFGTWAAALAILAFALVKHSSWVVTMMDYNLDGIRWACALLAVVLPTVGLSSEWADTLQAGLRLADAERIMIVSEVALTLRAIIVVIWYLFIRKRALPTPVPLPVRRTA